MLDIWPKFHIILSFASSVVQEQVEEQEQRKKDVYVDLPEKGPQTLWLAQS